MKSYCVYEKKITEYIPNSVKYTETKSGKKVKMTKCSSCGSIKIKFVKKII